MNLTKINFTEKVKSESITINQITQKGPNIENLTQKLQEESKKARRDAKNDRSI
jgi:hypothetical protein